MRVLAHRRAALVAILVAVCVGAALASACAGILETALRLDTPPQRLAGADLVVAAPERATLAAGDGRPAQPVTLTERSPLGRDVARAVAALPGVAGARRVAGVPGALAVALAPGASPSDTERRIAAAVAPWHLTVYAGDRRGRVEAPGVAGDRLTLILLGAIFGGMALVVMAMLLGSIVSLSVQQRGRELGLLRMAGATPRQVRRMVSRATVGPALPAAIAGALAGPVLADALLRAMQDGGVIAGVVVRHHGLLTMSVGAIAALALTAISAAIAARQTGRTRASDAVDEGVAPARLSPLRLALAAVAALAAGSCAVMTPFASAENAAAIGGGTALAAAIACAFVAPVLAERVVDRLAPAAQRLFGLPGALAAVNLRARAAQTGALLVPILLVVSVALANLYQETTQANGMRDDVVAGLQADAVVTAADGGPLPARVVAAARRAGRTSALVDSKGWIEHPVDKAHRIDPLRLVGAEGSAVASAVEHGSLRALRGDAVALPGDLARRLHLDVGDRVGVVLGDGARVELRVVALLGGPSRYPALVLPPGLLAAHTTDGARELLVNGSGDVAGRIRDALGAGGGVSVRGSGALGDDIDAGLRVDRWIAFAVVGVIAAYAAMSLANLVVASLGGRRRELALLRLSGATPADVRAMLRAEACLLAAGGIGVGTVVAVVGLVPLAVATAGSPLPSGPPGIFVAVAVLALALVLVPTTVVARRVVARRPAVDVAAI
jgi:putative ABC transport system permease protein